jgi:hypothetical protein
MTKVVRNRQSTFRLIIINGREREVVRSYNKKEAEIHAYPDLSPPELQVHLREAKGNNYYNESMKLKAPVVSLMLRIQANCVQMDGYIWS